MDASTQWIKVSWHEQGIDHFAMGLLKESNADFFILILRDGTEIAISKARCFKVERPADHPAEGER